MIKKTQRFKQTHGKSKGATVKVLKEDGVQLLVKDLKTKFKYHMSKVNLERHYKEIKKKIKSKKKQKKKKVKEEKDGNALLKVKPTRKR